MNFFHSIRVMGKQPIIFKVSPENALFEKLAVSAAKENITPAVLAYRVLSDYFNKTETDLEKIEKIKEKAQKLTYDQLMRFLKILESKSDDDINSMKITELVFMIKTIAQSIKEKGDTVVNNNVYQNFNVAIMNRRRASVTGKDNTVEQIETTAEPC